VSPEFGRSGRKLLSFIRKIDERDAEPVRLPIIGNTIGSAFSSNALSQASQAAITAAPAPSGSFEQELADLVGQVDTMTGATPA
jgi:hypothetical protein